MDALSNIFTALFVGVLASAIGIFFIIWIYFLIISSIVSLGLFVLWIIALVDCAKRNDKDFAIGGKNAKLIWLLLLIFLRGIVSIVYYLLIMRKVGESRRPEEL